MNITLWILQILLALHTAIGAFWKFSNSAEQTMPSLASIPSALWMTMSGLEIIVAVCLLAPLIKKHLAKFAPIAALVIVFEMLAFCGIHLASGDKNFGPMIYWLVTATLAGFVAYARLKLKPKA